MSKQKITLTDMQLDVLREALEVYVAILRAMYAGGYSESMGTATDMLGVADDVVKIVVTVED